LSACWFSCASPSSSRTQFELNIEMAEQLDTLVEESMMSYHRSRVELMHHNLEALCCFLVPVVAFSVLHWSRHSELSLSPRWPGEARDCALSERGNTTSTERVQDDLELRRVRGARDQTYHSLFMMSHKKRRMKWQDRMRKR
jgi:hypothetical protein